MALDHHEIDRTQIFNTRGIKGNHDSTVADVHGSSCSANVPTGSSDKLSPPEAGKPYPPWVLRRASATQGDGPTNVSHRSPGVSSRRSCLDHLRWKSDYRLFETFICVILASRLNSQSGVDSDGTNSNSHIYSTRRTAGKFK
jgi:hypothetical protein